MSLFVGSNARTFLLGVPNPTSPPAFHVPNPTPDVVTGRTALFVGSRGDTFFDTRAGAFPFSPPTTPATSSSGLDKPLYSPNLTAGPTGLDPYRPWRDAVVDGELYVANNFDQPRRWNQTLAAWSFMGSAAPTDFTPLSLTGTPGTAIPTGQTARYYLVGYSPGGDKETAPQGGGDVTIANASGITKNVVIPWTPGALPAEFTYRRIYRALDGTDLYKRTGEVLDATGTFTDTQTDATLRALATSFTWNGSDRTTLPPIFTDIVEDGARIWGLTVGEGNVLRYGRQIRLTSPSVVEDFPSGNLLQVGGDEGQGSPTAYVPFNGSAVVFFRKAIWEKTGDIPPTAACTRLSNARGTFNRRTVVALDRWLICLDARGVHRVTPGMYAGVVGTTAEMYHSPYQPLVDRMNLAASDLFHAQLLEESSQIVFWVALDYEPEPDTGLVFDYGKNRFIGIVTRRNPTAFGYLLDSAGTRHPCFGDDMGWLWEDLQGESEGCFAGANVGAVASASGLSLVSTTATLNTGIDGALGTPLVRIDRLGNQVDQNRVYATSAATITLYLYPSSAASTSDFWAVGVIPDVLEWGLQDFGTSEFKAVRDLFPMFASGIEGSIRFDTRLNDDDFLRKWEESIATLVRSDIPTKNVKTDFEDHAYFWALRFSQFYANLGYSVRGMYARVQVIAGERTKS